MINMFTSLALKVAENLIVGIEPKVEAFLVSEFEKSAKTLLDYVDKKRAGDAYGR